MIDETQDPEWLRYYHSALLELDHHKLRERIQEAETAIQLRVSELTGSGGAEVEYQAIRDALQNLRVLQQELADPDIPVSSERHVHPEVSGDYVVFVDANRRYLDVTESVCSLLGYSRAELLRKTIDDVTAPEIRGTVPEKFRQYIDAGGMAGQFLLLARDGRRVPIRYESRVFPDGCLVARWEPLPSAA